MRYMIWIIAAVFCASCTAVTGLKDIQKYGCPDTGFVRGLDRTKVIHEGIEYELAMTGLSGSCRFPSESRVILKTAFSVVAKAGDTAAAGKKLSIPYAVHILDENENIISRRESQARIEIDDSLYGVALEEFEQTIPLDTPEQSSRLKVIYSFSN